MYITPHSGGDIVYIHSNHETTGLSIIYFLPDHVDRENIHLLEHMIMNPYRILDNNGKSIEYACADLFVNARVTGSFIEFNGKTMSSDFSEMATTLIDIIDTPISPELLSEILSLERRTIDYENNEYYNLDEFSCLYKESNKKDLIDDIGLYSLYDNIFMIYKPLIIIKGNLGSKDNALGINLILQRLSSRQNSQSSSIQSFYNKEFLPLPIFSNIVKHNNRVYSVILGVRILCDNYHHYVMNVFTHLIIEYIINDFIRYKEITGYESKVFFRLCSQGFECTYHYNTRYTELFWKEKIINFLGDSPALFLQYKKKIYCGMYNATEVDNQETYIIAQSYLFLGTSTVGGRKMIAETIKDVTFEQYMDFLKEYRLPNMVFKYEEIEDDK